MQNSRPPFHIPGATPHKAPDKEFHAEHISIDLRVFFEEKRFEGSCTTTLVPLRKDSAVLHLDAREMTIRRVELDGKGAQFDHDGKVLTVRPAGSLAISPHKLRVDYAATPRQGVYFVSPDKEHPEKPIQAWSQCEPEFGRYWYPASDHPNDKSTSEMRISVPDGFRVVSNGRLVSTEKNNGWTAWHWKEDVPHSTYLNSFAAGKFELVEEKAGDVLLQYYFPESKKADWKRLFGLTPEMVRIFEDLTRMKYPFEKYAQVTVHDFLIGGMENISATTLADTRFPDARSEEDYAARYSRPDRNHIELVAHELAHMWFGDLVTAKHWSHLWLNEGFATYFQALFTERKSGTDDFREDMRAKSESYFEDDKSRGRRAVVEEVYVSPEDVFDAVVYEKAAWMLHQLRFLLGEELFFGGTAEYLRRFARKNVDTHDYMNVLEEVSGLSLEGYFEQSFFKGGHPEFEVEYSWDEANKRARLRIKQVQQTDELTPVFILPCDVALYTSTGRHVRRLNIRGSDETYFFESDEMPSIVEFDPEERLLKRVKFPKSSSLLANQLAKSADASSRRKAAEALSEFKTEDSVSALKAALKREQHWPVRAEAARSLGKIGTKESLEALLAARAERHRRVRRAVIAALGEFKDERVLPPLLSALRGDESPYVQCEAALSYAKAGAPDAVQVLTSCLDIPSPEHAITEACLEASGYVKSPATRQLLERYLPYGMPTRARIGALKGFTRLGWLEEREVALLKEVLLKDKEFGVRLQVLETVNDLLDRRFVETVRRASEEDVDARVRRRAMEVGIRLSEAASTRSALAEIKDDVQKARAENRQLVERMSGMKLA